MAIPGYRPYGGTTADLVTDVQAVGAAGEEVLTPAPGATLTAWTDQAAGEQITDLLDTAGAAITLVTADSQGVVPRFYAPEAHLEVWLDGGAGRVQVLPSDIGSITPGVSNWSDIEGKPSAFPPAGHSHVASDDITGLMAAVLSVLTGDVPGVRLAVSVTYDDTAWPTVPASIATSQRVQLLFMDFEAAAGVPTQGREGIDVVFRDSSGA